VSERAAAIDQRIAELKRETEAKTSELLAQPLDSHPVEWWSTRSAMTMSATMLLFGLAVLGIATFLIRRGRDTDAVLRLFGTLVIVISAVFLVVAGYSDRQIAPVMGLLGTIAGYLLGKDRAPAAPPTAAKEPGAE
jgi:hypothetical protein